MTRASTLLLWFSLTILVSVGLYHTSYRVEELDRQLRTLNAQIEAEQSNIHVLKAEWVYLSNPQRIEDAARKHLADLHPTAPKQVANLDRLNTLIPTRDETVADSGLPNDEPAAYRARPAARTPRPAAGEQGHLNTRLVIGSAAQVLPSPSDTSLTVAQDSGSFLPSGSEP